MSSINGGPDYAIDSGRPIPAEWRSFSLDTVNA
jgi:hypothetical protein